MIFGLGRLFYVVLLLVNAVAVLNEQRFLRRIGLGSKSNQPSFGQPENSTKSKLIHLISAVQTLLRIPLIAINILVIVYELILG
ncbi:Yos1p Ecym_3499 [Eremothecium cymbalariae DBVPG|uniref:Yos1-like protein n=1 Tax=Eremothecium cymbalariae (strain CBS 270.75 / DBVPG 7215 / KCTC 17166 / NRRL Y-17582) TaxID=931890 RepID=G8JS60_ERECY|nr:Hypothetical protein Ecym_3499 [Eremothecium cymbalariae DBVPG\